MKQTTLLTFFFYGFLPLFLFFVNVMCHFILKTWYSVIIVLFWDIFVIKLKDLSVFTNSNNIQLLEIKMLLIFNNCLWFYKCFIVIILGLIQWMFYITFDVCSKFEITFTPVVILKKLRHISDIFSFTTSFYIQS